jgi:hypothetical protein
MNKKLEDFFNVESMEIDRSESTNEDQLELVTAENISAITETITVPSTVEVSAQLDLANRIDKALPQVKGLEVEDRDLDDYANKAMESFEKLMDLGMNVDDRNAGVIFDVASKMMNAAISAKTAKLDKKLKMVDLQLKAARLAQTQKPEEENSSPNGELNTDRNAILNLISQNLKKH